MTAENLWLSGIRYKYLDQQMGAKLCYEQLYFVCWWADCGKILKLVYDKQKTQLSSQTVVYTLSSQIFSDKTSNPQAVRVV